MKTKTMSWEQQFKQTQSLRKIQNSLIELQWNVIEILQRRIKELEVKCKRKR